MRQVIVWLMKSIHLLGFARAVKREMVGLYKNLSWYIRRDNTLASDGLPYPPPRLCFIVSGNYDPGYFFSSGANGAKSIRCILERNGKQISDFQNILDFGCGCGRIIRHWNGIQGIKISGTDINSLLIKWARKKLKFAHFRTNSLFSRLTYPDEAFDFIYAISVFTHLKEELQLWWMNELTRILRPGGFLLITVKGEDKRSKLDSADVERFDSGKLIVVEAESSGSNYCAAYHPDSYVRNVLSGNLTVMEHERSGSKDTGQDFYLFRKMG